MFLLKLLALLSFIKVWINPVYVIEIYFKVGRMLIEALRMRSMFGIVSTMIGMTSTKVGEAPTGVGTFQNEVGIVRARIEAIASQNGKTRTRDGNLLENKKSYVDNNTIRK